MVWDWLYFRRLEALYTILTPYMDYIGYNQQLCKFFPECRPPPLVHSDTRYTWILGTMGDWFLGEWWFFLQGIWNVFNTPPPLSSYTWIPGTHGYDILGEGGGGKVWGKLVFWVVIQNAYHSSHPPPLAHLDTRYTCVLYTWGKWVRGKFGEKRKSSRKFES